MWGRTGGAGYQVSCAPVLFRRSLNVKENMITDKDTEIRDQAHLMEAEGSSNEPINEYEIREYLRKKGWLAKDLDIWFDSMQGVSRWVCNIEPIDLSPVSNGTIITDLKRENGEVKAVAE
jgi:hypothetical protein